MCDACEEWWGCGQTWPCPLSKQHPILSAMVGPDGSIHMAEYRSLEPKKLQLISRFLADTIPCLYLVGHACEAEPLIVQIIILIRNVTMAWFFFVQKSGEIRVYFPIFFHCTVDGIVRHSLAVMSSEIRTMCRLHVFHLWYVSIIQYFGQECKLYVDGSIF